MKKILFTFLTPLALVLLFTAAFIFSKPSKVVRFEDLPTNLFPRPEDHLLGIGLSPNGSAFILDTSTLKVDGKNRTFLLLMMPPEGMVTPKGDPIELIISQEMVNCETHQYKGLANVVLGRDKVLAYKTTPTEWKSVPPNAVMANKMEEMVCTGETAEDAPAPTMPRSRSQLDQKLTNI